MEHEERIRLLLGSKALTNEFNRCIGLKKQGLLTEPSEELKNLIWQETILLTDGIYKHLDYDTLEARRAIVFEAIMSKWSESYDMPQFYAYKRIGLRALFDYMKVERYVMQYGTGYRKVIQEALIFLNEKEPGWGLTEPINRDDYIWGIINKASLPADKSTKADLGYSRVGLNNV